MLEAAGVPFEIVDAHLNEDDVKASLIADGLGAAELALALAREKVLVAKAGPGNLVLGSDQTLELDSGGMLDKPASREDALAQLKSLSGRRHTLHSAAAIVENGSIVWSGIESVTMHVRTLGAGFLDWYLDREFETVRWSVGAYHVEGFGAQLFERIDGSHFAVQGLPLLPLLEYLRQRGVLLT